MFGLFKKDPSKRLSDKYDNIMAKAFLFPRTNRLLSDQKYVEADSIIQQIKAEKNAH